MEDSTKNKLITDINSQSIQDHQKKEIEDRLNFVEIKSISNNSATNGRSKLKQKSLFFKKINYI